MKRKMICILAAMAIMVMGGASSAITTRAVEGIEPYPCPYCGDGTVWRLEEHYKVQVGTRACIDGFTKGSDTHYENRALVSVECIDCEMLKEYWVETYGNYWKCEGYNGQRPGSN